MKSVLFWTVGQVVLVPARRYKTHTSQIDDIPARAIVIKFIYSC